MSAIFGIWNLDGKAVDENYLNKMKDTVIHYGKDAQDIYINENIGLGSCLNKFSIHSQDRAPICINNNEKTILVADAQIYNREELIKDCVLTDNKLICNNQLIIEAYKKWGQDFPKYINGDFSVVIWEKEKNQLIVVRDHLGVRPLYYYYSESTFVFATDYRAILTLPFVVKEIDEIMLYKLLSGNGILKTENTYLKNIKKLKPAYSLKVKKSGISKYKYWTPGLGGNLIYSTEEEYFQALHKVVYKAIKCRIDNTNCDIGAQMSGGLDSSVVTVLANRELKKEKKKLTLFSWSPSFEALEKQPRDEREVIELVCQQEGLECLYYDVNKGLDNRNLEKEMPIESISENPLYQELENMSLKNIKCVLTGWGGDEGISHRANLFELFVNGYFIYFIKEAYGLSKGSLLRFVKIIIGNTIIQLFKPFNYFGINKGKINIANRDFNKVMKKYKKKIISYFNINLVKCIESGCIQTRTEVSACIGADYNVQYLFPFLDYNVINFAVSVPRHMYYKNGINRYVYRKAFENILSEGLADYIDKKDDDVARAIALSSKRKDSNIEKEILENKIDKQLFSKYIDFDKATELLCNLDNDNEFRRIMQVKRQINICYNIQKALTKAQKEVKQ